MEESYDCVVRNGLIVDGTGKAPFRGDVAIVAGRIVAVGAVAGSGREEIDAEGRVVTPGFVDVHTHYDGQITWENRMKPSSNHGVTTVVMGNCGVGFAPVRASDRELAVKLMEGVEDIPEVVMAEGLPWNWTTFPDYLDALESREADVDFATQVPHSPLRIFVMGERGANLEPPTDADLSEMRRLTAEAVRAGALGVSTSRNLFHRFRDGKLAPSVNTADEELVALAMGLADAGTGVFQCVPRMGVAPEGEMAAFRQVARKSGRPVNFSLVFTTEDVDAVLGSFTSQLDEARDEGLDIRAHFLPRALGALFGLDLSYHCFSLNPSYRAIAHLPLAERVARMRDPEFRRQLLSEEPDDPNPMFVGLVKSRRHFYLLSDPVDYRFSLDESLHARAVHLGLPEDEVIYDALLENDGHAILALHPVEPTLYIDRSLPLMARNDTVVSLGDGGAHYGMICDAAYPTFMLAQLLEPDHSNLALLVRHLTSRPAASVGLNDRGVIAPGFKADLNVLEIDAMSAHRPTIMQDLPSGGKRLAQRATGYVLTMVSGQVTYRNGEPTGALPGRLARGAREAHSPLTRQPELAAL